MSSKLPKTLISRFLQWYSSLWPIPYPKPPYEHICPIGDQNLRCKAQSVDVNVINSAEIQTIIQKMIKVLRKYSLVGISAPQIGVSYQIFIVEFTEKEKNKFHHDTIKAREMEVFPLKVFINPILSVINNRKINFPEGCACIKGYSAIVPRCYEIKVK
ncbi:peptide deformylase, mitochondrial-like, partial [Centruroides vittatus]|uniref:peptide deformylase, mitochondrial-like n=1 Tax=Centruroides vittatus TaxID=120091 RepID=UPI003510A1E5